MSALAQLLHARGVLVSGSDTAEHYFTQETLAANGIPYVEEFHADHVPTTVDLVVRSSAYDDTHVEVAEALRRGLHVVTYAEAVAMLFNAGRGIAICGTHGKTTTTAMLGWILVSAGRDPSVIVGGAVPQLGGAARAGASDLVVLEADEYQDKLQHYAPYGVILTNIEYDHPDFFATPSAYAAAFHRFIARIPTDGFLVIHERDAEAEAAASAARCRIIRVPAVEDDPGALVLLLPGAHNRRNALAATAAAEILGVSRATAFAALATFRGSKRRFEIVGEAHGAVIVDDYAHHPTEVRATIAAARERFPDRRIVVVFQPHTFTRTIALRDDFARAFDGADQVLVMDIFGSARETQGGISSAEFATAIGRNATASGDVDATIAGARSAMLPGDVVLCLGAGRNDAVARALVSGVS